MLTLLAEKFLDQLEGADYDAFIEYLQPEMIKAKKTISGKQIAAVCRMRRVFLFHNIQLMNISGRKENAQESSVRLAH